MRGVFGLRGANPFLCGARRIATLEREREQRRKQKTKPTKNPNPKVCSARKNTYSLRRKRDGLVGPKSIPPKLSSKETLSPENRQPLTIYY